MKTLLAFALILPSCGLTPETQQALIYSGKGVVIAILERDKNKPQPQPPQK